MLAFADILERYPYRVFDRPDKYLAELLRDLSYRVSPIGPIVLQLAGIDPMTAWSMNRTRVTRALEDIGEGSLAGAYVGYFLARWRWFLSRDDDLDALRDAVRAAWRFLNAPNPSPTLTSLRWRPDTLNLKPRRRAIMDLYILRHGKAEPYGGKYPADHLRPLMPKGRKRTKLSVKGMKSVDVKVDLIVSSPILRARQTAEIVHEGLGLKQPVEFSDSLASGSVTGVMSAIQAYYSYDGVMLVGHEPTLSELISTMSSGLYHVAFNLKPGGLCKLRVDTARIAQSATIEWFLPPKLLVAMG